MNFFESLWQGIIGFGPAFAEKIYDNFIKQDRYMWMVEGLGVTLMVSICAILLGVIMGAITFFMRRSRFGILRSIGYLYVDIVRGTPLVTQLFIIYFVVFASIHINPVLIGIFAFAFNSGAYVSEIIRAGVLSIDRGQTEAGRSLGLTSGQTMTYIVAPQAVKNILPALCNEFVVLIKETAVIGYLAVNDLTKASDAIRSRTFDAYVPLLTAALVYYIIIKSLTIVISRLERKLRASDIR